MVQGMATVTAKRNYREEFFKIPAHDLPASFLDVCPFCWCVEVVDKLGNTNLGECGHKWDSTKIYFSEAPLPDAFK